METPVLLITFNRPEYTKIMLEALKYAPTWGWAIWKKVWDNFSLHEQHQIKPFFKDGGFTNQFASKKKKKFQQYKNALNKESLKFH